MNYRLFWHIGVLVMLLIATVSCSGGSTGNDSPVTPDLAPQAETPASGHQLLLFTNIVLNPEEGTAEIIPLRNVEEHLNILKFLETGMCSDCFKIVGITPTVDNTWLIDIQIQHPLTSKDFTIFDVRGIMMFPGSKIFAATSEDDLITSNMALGEGALVNADGHTTNFNPSTIGNGPGGLYGYYKGKFGSETFPNSTLNGYKRHISPGPLNTRNALFVDSVVTTQYELKFQIGGFVFGYAVDCSWALPDNQPVEDPMEDFPPDANALEPWRIEITEEAIGQGLTDQGGETRLWIDVYDHQGMSGNPAPTVECFELFDGTAEAAWSSDGDGYSTYEVTVQNEKIAAQGEYMCLVAAEDSENLNNLNYNLTGYRLIILTVGEFVVQVNEPPVAAAHADAYSPNPGQTVSFFDDSTDPDGNEDIIEWEWDFSFDPIDGFMVGSEEQNPQIAYPTEGTYKVQLRVTDTDDNSDMLDDPLTITVSMSGNQKPTAAAHADNYEPEENQKVFLFDDSTDPDGNEDIIEWEWDFSFNPIDGFNPGGFVQNPEIQYLDAGTYKVQLRVTDTADNSDLLDVPLEIVVGGGTGEMPVACGDVDNPHPSTKELVYFYDCSIDPDGPGDIVYFEWDLDGDGVYDKFIKDTTHIYYQGGDYYVQHQVTDSTNNVDDLDDPILVEVNGPPIADAEVDLTDVSVGETVTFTNLSLDDDGNGDIVHVYWDMDGNNDYDDPIDIQDQDQVFFQFYEPGIHFIGLKVVDEWGLEDVLDPKLQVTVTGLDPFCVNLIDQWNSADHLYGIRGFEYYNNSIDNLDGLDYQAPNGPWDFTVVPPSAPAICEWLLPTDPGVPALAESTWPNADFFFKEDAPTMGQDIYCPHEFDFVDAENGDLILEGQYHAGTIYQYNDTFEITHPICHPWIDFGSGSGSIGVINFDISWDMATLGTGPAIFMINGNLEVLNCILIRHHMTFVDTDPGGYMTFYLLNYQWIDEEGNEVAFMQATNGLEDENFFGNDYTGKVICRALKNIS